MNASHVLVIPALEKLRNEFENLNREIESDPSVESLQIKKVIKNRLQKISNIRHAFDLIVPAELHEEYRNLKRDFRFALRKRMRMISSASRSRKLRARRGVSSIEA